MTTVDAAIAMIAAEPIGQSILRHGVARRSAQASPPYNPIPSSASMKTAANTLVVSKVPCALRIT